MKSNLCERTCGRSIAAQPWYMGVLASLFSVVVPTMATGQLPGAPVLQNAWATPGLMGAVNVGGGSDGTVYAAAASWTPRSGRVQVSGGLGSRSRTDEPASAVYGLRVAMPVSGSATSGLGFAAFAGVGGGNSQETTAGAVDTISTTQIPVGAAIGWRRAIGASRGISIYASPSYTFFSGGSASRGISIYASPSYTFFSGGSDGGGLVRAAAGADIGISRSIGLTVGAEFGQTRRRAVGGPSGTLYGIGVAYAFGRR
jgi:hypothetical protein